MFERFTDRGRQVLVLAQEEAHRLGHSFLGTEHILLGLVHEGEGIAAKSLESFGVTLEAVRIKVDGFIGPGDRSGTGSPPFTPRAKKTLELSLREALELGHDYISTEHLLLGLLREGEGVAAQVLRDFATLSDVRLRVLTFMQEADLGEDRMKQSVRLPPAPIGPSGEVHHYPIRVLGGSDSHLVSESIEFRVVGVLVYDSGVRVLWRMSKIPLPAAVLVRESDTGEPRRFSVRDLFAMSDDVGTTYLGTAGSFEPQQAQEWAGECHFSPRVPDSAHVLRVGWEGQFIEVAVL